MAGEIKSDQRITRLAPLADVLAHIESRVKPVAASRHDIAAASGLTLADDICVAHPVPSQATALRDGFAVHSEAVRDAGPYSPVTLSSLAFVNAGETLPPGTDAVLPSDAVTQQGSAFNILSPAIPGDGVLAQGADAAPATPLLRAGQVLRHGRLAVLHAAGIASISVRAPRIAIHRIRSGDDAFLDAALAWLTHAIASAGGRAVCIDGSDLESALHPNLDGAIVLGGTGTGENDDAVIRLARAGEIAFHGMAIAPGDTAALGFAHEKPVLLFPGRLDAAIACWLLAGEKMLDCLTGRHPQQTGYSARLKRKVTSPLGVTEIIPVSCNGEDAEPLASTYLPLQALARADGWIAVPAQSEGYPAGTSVTVRPLP